MRANSKIATEEHLDFLDQLKVKFDSGEAVRSAYSPPLMSKFSLAKKDARIIVRHWIDTFDERHAA